MTVHNARKYLAGYFRGNHICYLIGEYPLNDGTTAKDMESLAAELEIAAGILHILEDPMDGPIDWSGYKHFTVFLEEDAMEEAITRLRMGSDRHMIDVVFTVQDWFARTFTEYRMARK